MNKLRNFVFSAGLLSIVSGCATIADKITPNVDVAGTYVVQDDLRNDINTLLNMYKWGFYEQIPELSRQIYDKIPDELEDNFFVVDAVLANAIRKEAVKAGEETMYWDSEATTKRAFTKMDEAFNNSGMGVEEWLNDCRYVDSNRLSKWILLDTWGLLQKDYILAGLSDYTNVKNDLYISWAYFEMARKLVEDLDGDWNTLEKISDRHIGEVQKILEDLVN